MSPRWFVGMGWTACGIMSNYFIRSIFHYLVIFHYYSRLTQKTVQWISSCYESEVSPGCGGHDVVVCLPVSEAADPPD